MNRQAAGLKAAWIVVVPALILIVKSEAVYAQRGGGQRGAAPSARAAAPVDLTGYWISVISEDWKYRMVTPPKGQYGNVPMSAEGRRVADSWDPSKDEAAGTPCKAYGAAGIMRIPARLHVAWENDSTLRVDIDAGTQTRLFHFDKPRTPTDPTWQGQSVAQWESAGGRGTRFTDTGVSEQGGFMKVVTTRMRAGYLRKNGVPYSADTVMTEYFERHLGPNGEQYLVVTAIIEDPQYLNGAYVTSANFKKLPDSTGWDPAPCSAR
jgi:hypothetical protein